MMTFESKIQELFPVNMPAWSGTRIMMMPFHTHEVKNTLPGYLRHYTDIVTVMSGGAPEGVGYLTIDEALLDVGETHRRPGLHVDGIGPDGRAGGWGGGGGYGSNGMTMVSNAMGCAAYNQGFEGWPGPNGDCEHLRSQLGKPTYLKAHTVYECGPLTVHEGLPMSEMTPRKFIRVSYPSNCPWYEGYTINPLGIKPAGPIHPPRTEFMNYRA